MPSLVRSTHADVNTRHPADTLVANLPHDQALGLRLMAMARAAAAQHMAEVAYHQSTALDHTQAAGLFQTSGLFRAEARS